MASKTDAWMPLWIGAYLADTQHLVRDEHGGYLLLIMAYWRTASPLPDDDKRLAAITKATPKEWKALRITLSEFFQVADGVWRHKRIDQELADALDKKTKSGSKAQAAALARWKDHKRDNSSNAPSNAPSIPQAKHDECPTPSPTPSIKPSDTNVSGGEPPKVTDPDEIIFGYGVPLLVSAGTPDKNARSFLGGLRKAHGDTAVIDKLRECIKAKPLQPLEWLAAALPPKGGKGRGPTHENFAAKDYGKGVNPL